MEIYSISKREVEFLTAVFDRESAGSPRLPIQKFPDLLKFVLPGVNIEKDQLRYWTGKLSKTNSFSLQDFLAWHENHVV